MTTVRLWYRDTLSCLQSTTATLLIQRGEDPLTALGLNWDFLYIPGDYEPQEYYYPCRYPGDVIRSILPYHPATSGWRIAGDPDPYAELEAVLAEGRLPVIAVDNFHLPFRPAYHDVHSKHLLVVHAIDRSAGTVRVSDAQPPAFDGSLDADVLLKAWRVGGATNERNVFFSGKLVETVTRWLDVRLDTPFPEFGPERLRTALQANLHRFGPAAGEWSGLPGLRRYLSELVDGARSLDRQALVESYTFGWGVQAQASLHGELLRKYGFEWQMPALSEAGRRVEQVAHRWSAVRVQSAHGHSDPVGAAEPLARHGRRLLDTYDQALESIETAIATLPAGRPVLDPVA
jgi:hypothetical protein